MALPTYRRGRYNSLPSLVTQVGTLWLLELVGPISPALANSDLLGLMEKLVKAVGLALGEEEPFTPGSHHFHLILSHLLPLWS